MAMSHQRAQIFLVVFITFFGYLFTEISGFLPWYVEGDGNLK